MASNKISIKIDHEKVKEWLVSGGAPETVSQDIFDNIENIYERGIILGENVDDLETWFNNYLGLNRFQWLVTLYHFKLLRRGDENKS